MALQRKYDAEIKGISPNKVFVVTDNATSEIVITIHQKDVSRIEGIFIPSQVDPGNPNQKTPKYRPVYPSANGDSDRYAIDSVTKVVFFIGSDDNPSEYSIELQHIDNNSDWNGGDAADVTDFLSGWNSVTPDSDTITVTGSGTIAAGATLLSIYVSGGSNGGFTIGAGSAQVAYSGATYNYGTPGNLLPAIAYDATGTEMQISFIR